MSNLPYGVYTKVTDPHHYTQGDIQPIDFIIANDMDYLEGNIIKYISRYKYKNGIEDLLKAQAYLTYLINKQEEEEQEGLDE